MCAGVTTDKPFLFIGVLSSRRTFRRRLTVRNTWLQYVTHTPTKMVDVKFVLSPDEVWTPHACLVAPNLRYILVLYNSASHMHDCMWLQHLDAQHLRQEARPLLCALENQPTGSSRHI